MQSTRSITLTRETILVFHILIQKMDLIGWTTFLFCCAVHYGSRSFGIETQFFESQKLLMSGSSYKVFLQLLVSFVRMIILSGPYYVMAYFNRSFRNRYSLWPLLTNNAPLLRVFFQSMAKQGLNFQNVFFLTVSCFLKWK